MSDHVTRSEVDEFECEKCGWPARVNDTACQRCGSPFRFECAACGKPTSATSTVCESCGQEFMGSNSEDHLPDPGPPAPSSTALVKPEERQTGESTIDERVIVLRPGADIWHSEETEDTPVPGRRRPLLVIEERTIHLTDVGQINIESLESTIRDVLATLMAQCDHERVLARWQRDPEETRSRLVVSLPGHRYSDFKALFGYDQMGNWANLHIQLAREPERLPHQPSPPPRPIFQPMETPPRPARGPMPVPKQAIALSILGLLGIVIAGSVSQALVGFLSAVILVWAIISWSAAYQEWEKQGELVFRNWVATMDLTRVKERDDHEKAVREWEALIRRQDEEWKRMQAQQTMKRAEQRLARTFKVDDFRLFRAAMNETFRDLVERMVQAGARVVG